MRPLKRLGFLIITLPTMRSNARPSPSTTDQRLAFSNLSSSLIEQGKWLAVICLKLNEDNTNALLVSSADNVISLFDLTCFTLPIDLVRFCDAGRDTFLGPSPSLLTSDIYKGLRRSCFLELATPRVIIIIIKT
jgi:hypothetical protein